MAEDKTAAETNELIEAEWQGLRDDVRCLKRLAITQDRTLHAMATGRDADAAAAITALNAIRRELGWGTFTPAIATPPGYAVGQLRAIEAFLCEVRPLLRQDITLDTAGLVKVVVEGARADAQEAWLGTGDAERDNDRLRTEHAAYLAGRAPAGMVRVTIEGAHVGTGNASAYIVGRDVATRESDGRTYPLAEFLALLLPEVLGYALEDAEEAATTEHPEEGTA